MLRTTNVGILYRETPRRRRFKVWFVGGHGRKQSAYSLVLRFLHGKAEPVSTLNLYSGVIMNARIRRVGLVAFCLMTATQLWAQQVYKYFRLGSSQDSQSRPSFGIAMMGGGSDLDEAFRWLCKKGNGGDFLILRARGDDDYNSYVNGLCKANSVATLIIPDRAAAEDPSVAEIIRKSEVVFIAGGDQANYIRGWRGTPVEKAN